MFLLQQDAVEKNAVTQNVSENYSFQIQVAGCFLGKLLPVFLLRTKKLNLENTGV